MHTSSASVTSCLLSERMRNNDHGALYRYKPGSQWTQTSLTYLIQYIDWTATAWLCTCVNVTTITAAFSYQVPSSWFTLLMLSCYYFVVALNLLQATVLLFCTEVNISHRDIHITAKRGQVRLMLISHVTISLFCTNQYCHSHIQMYICIYISMFIVYFYSCNIAVLLFMCMSVLILTSFGLVLAFNVDRK